LKSNKTEKGVARPAVVTGGREKKLLMPVGTKEKRKFTDTAKIREHHRANRKEIPEGKRLQCRMKKTRCSQKRPQRIGG